MTNITSSVVKKFAENVDSEKVYNLKELKNILDEAFNTVNTEAKNAAKKNKEAKPKRAPTAYNNFVSTTIKKIKADDASISTKEAMVKAGGIWKTMTDEQKKEFNTKPDDNQ
jgi:hypothetical protein